MFPKKERRDTEILHRLQTSDLNVVTKSYVFLLPRIDDIMDKLGRCQFFISIDLKHAFWQIPMKKEDKVKTAFICGYRLWNYILKRLARHNLNAKINKCDNNKMFDDFKSPKVKKVEWTENDISAQTGLSVLSSIPSFDGAKHEQARRFMTDFEEALDLVNFTWKR